jgi:thiol-disulfide isomerase/thioredoxin
MRKAVIGVLIAVIIVAGTVLLERSYRMSRKIPQRSSQDGVVRMVSGLKLAQLDGKTVSLDDFKGKVLLLNFWASWCSACMSEMPSIQKLYTTLKSEGLEVIAINVDENPKSVVPVVTQKLGLNFKVFVDIDGILSQKFEVVALPYSIVVDRNFNVVWSEAGERDWASPQVLDEMRKFLKEDGESSGK